MPQMAPISWLLLFVIFTITLILFNIFNYYSSLPNTPESVKTQPEENKYNSPFMSWKW